MEKMTQKEMMIWKRSAALELKKRGASIRQIMNALGYNSISAVQNLLKK